MSLEELIIQMQPFSDELKDWCKKHPEFLKGLKIINVKRFMTLQALITSGTSNSPGDEVIGVFVYDFGLKKPRFKQDFIVNIGGKNQKFVLYTADTNGSESRFVKHINQFYATYGKNGAYAEQHWLSLEDLPEDLKPRAQNAIGLAEKIKEYGVEHITQEKINDIYDKYRNIEGVRSEYF